MEIDKISLNRHNEHYKIETVEEIKKKHEEAVRGKFQYNADNPIGLVVDSLSGSLEIAVDIGSGQGFGSKYLSENFKTVYSIEPSTAAMEMSKKLYGNVKNITWINDFAETGLAELKLKKPALFYCACVLSHLNDHSVEKICKNINKIAKPGSFLSMSENWGRDVNQNLWHSRTKDWWKRQFPDWDLNFRDIPGAPPGVKKGIVGVKKP